MCLDSTCFVTGRHTEYLCCFLNSKMGHYMLKDAPTTGTGDLLVSVQAVEPLRVPTIDDGLNAKFKVYLENRQERDIENTIFDLYGLDEEEREFIRRRPLTRSL